MLSSRLKNHYSSLLKLGLPIMLGQLGVIVLGFADTMMVGRYSTDSLGAASFVNNMFNLVIVFSTGFSYGLTPVVGGMYGRKESSGIGETLKNGLVVNGIMALVLTMMMFVIYLNIHRLGQPEEILPLMRPYYLVLLASLVPVLLFNAFKQFSEGITDTMTPMYILVGGNVLNIIGNWLLIYGKAGFPEMGLLGAGVATLVSRILMPLVFFLIFMLSDRYKDYRKGFVEGRVNKSDCLNLNRMGLPVGMQMGMETASFSLSTIMVGWLGTTALAAHQVMLTVGQLGYMMYYGMAAAVAVRVSNFHGKQDISEVHNAAKAGFHLIMAMAVISSTVVLLFRSRLGFLFSESADVALMVSYLVIPFVIYQFGDGLQCNYSNALRGVSDVKMVSWYALIAYFIISLPAGYLFGFVFDLGLVGVWLSFPLGLTSAGILFWHRFRKAM